MGKDNNGAIVTIAEKTTAFVLKSHLHFEFSLWIMLRINLANVFYFIFFKQLEVDLKLLNF